MTRRADIAARLPIGFGLDRLQAAASIGGLPLMNELKGFDTLPPWIGGTLFQWLARGIVNLLGAVAVRC